MKEFIPFVDLLKQTVTTPDLPEKELTLSATPRMRKIHYGEKRMQPDMPTINIDTQKTIRRIRELQEGLDW